MNTHTVGHLPSVHEAPERRLPPSEAREVLRELLAALRLAYGAWGSSVGTLNGGFVQWFFSRV